MYKYVVFVIQFNVAAGTFYLAEVKVTTNHYGIRACSANHRSIEVL